MAEIRARDDLVLTVNRLMICAMEDIDSGRNEASPTTLDLVQRIEDCDAALRLALDTATRERDEARANISEVIEPEFFDKVMAAAVSEKELAALVADRDAYKLRLSEVARDMAKSIVFWQKRATENGKRDCQCGPTHEGDSCIDCRFRAVTNDLCSALDRAVEAERGCGELHAELTAMNQRALDAEVERDGWKASYQTTEEVLGWVRAERDDIAAWAESWMKRVAAAERERDEARARLARIEEVTRDSGIGPAAAANNLARLSSPAPPADAAREALRYCEEVFQHNEINRVDGEEIADRALVLIRRALSTPAPAPSAKEDTIEHPCGCYAPDGDVCWKHAAPTAPAMRRCEQP